MANCEACGGKVNEVVAKCPHCGEKRAMSAPTFSKAEIHAIIANEETLRSNQDGLGLFRSLVVPHKTTRGPMRLLEIALTAVTLPAVVVGAVGLSLVGARYRKASYGTTGELMPVVVMTLMGGGTIAMWLGAEYAMLAISAMWARAAVRMISGGKHERSLLEPDLPAPTTIKGALPPARVVTGPVPVVAAPAVAAPARPSTPAIRTPEPPRPVEPAQPANPAEPGDEPSILR